MSDLLPCAHCGHATAPVIVTAEEHYGDLWIDEGHADSFAVMCNAERPNGPGGCGASGGFAPTEAEAAALWNRRAAPTVATREPLTERDFWPMVGDLIEANLRAHDAGIQPGTTNWAAKLIRAVMRGIAARGTSTASTDGEVT